MAFAGLGNWFKKRLEDTRDIFDANTAADQQRRLAAGQPRFYQDQQAMRNQQAQQAPQNRSAFEQIGYNIAGGLSDIAKAPGAILDLKASIDKTPIGQVADLANPLNYGKNIINVGKDVIQNKPIGTTTFGQNTQLQKFGRGQQDLLENKVQQSRFGQKEADNKWIGGAARAVGNVGGQIGLAAATGGSSVPALAAGATTFSQQQQQAKQAGKSDSSAFNIGVAQGGVEAALEKVGLDKVLGAGGSVVRRFGTRSATEGGTEAVQQFASNVIKNRTYDPNQSLTEGVKEAAVFGAVGGGVGGVALDVGRNPKQVVETVKNADDKLFTPANTRVPREEVRDLLDYADYQIGNYKPDLKEVNRLSQVARQVSNKSNTNLFNGPPETIRNNILSFVDEYDQARTKVSQGGYIGSDKPKLPDPPEFKIPKPKGFIIKETKPRGGRIDTIRISKDPQTGKMRSTTQSELTPEAQQYAETFGVSPEEAVQAMKRIKAGPESGGTIDALSKVENSGKQNIVKDLQDQQDFGVKEIQEKPTNTIDDVINQYLEIDQMTDAELDTPAPKNSLVGAFTNARESVKKTNVLRYANDKAAEAIERTSRGGVGGRKFTRVLQYINKNAGQDPAMVKAARQYAGENTFTDSGLLQVGKQIYDLVPDTSSRARVHAVLDPESAGNSLKFDDLKPNEQQAVAELRDLGDAINDSSYRAGFISKKKWESNRGGRYIARLYNEVATAEDVADLLELPDKRGLHLGMYKSRTDLNDDLRQRLIRDPVKLAVIRARQVRQNEALMQYMFTAEGKGYVRNSPTPGFIKVPPQNRMANWAGKYVRQDVYENIEGFKALGKGMNALNAVLDVYDGNPLRRMRKKLLTIYNPVVRTGNITSNYFFAYLNGVNPLTFQKNKTWAHDALKNNNPLMIAAQKSGLIGNDIVKTDKNIFNKDQAFITELERNTQSKMQKIKGAPRKFDETLSNRYGNADDVAKLAALKSHVDRGIPVSKAIEMTRRGFQDYSRVGHAYDMAAKSPIFGNAFIRFQGDLYTNILKNAAVDHPVRLAAMVAGMAALGEGLSNLSSESDEDKKTREDRPGAPKIPFTNISTEFQTPLGAVDIARFTPLYMRQDVDGNSLSDNISRIAPFNVLNPLNTSKEELVKKGATDPLIGPLISIVGDTDWRGKSVADPDGVRDGKQLYPDDPLSTTDRNINRLQYGIRSYAPYPANEIGDILAAITQDKKNEQTAPGTKNDPSKGDVPLSEREGFNTTGSKKSTGQALARLFGIRAEKFGPEEAADKREMDALFAFFDKTDQFKAGLDDQTRKSFESRHKTTQTRSGVQKEFEDDPWYKYKNASELLENPKLFEAEKGYAQLQNEFDGKPIDPVFDLPPDQRNMVLAKKMKLPGSKDEGFNSLYDQEWYQDFRGKQDEYYKAKKAYNQSRGFKEHEVDNPYPEASPDLQKAMDAYFALPKGTGERSAFIRNNPDLWARITGQWDAQNAWTDKEREKLGLPKIERDDKDGYAGGGGGKGKGMPSFKIADAPNFTGKLKVSKAKAPTSQLKIVQPKKPSAVKIKLAKKAKTIKKT